MVAVSLYIRRWIGWKARNFGLPFSEVQGQRAVKQVRDFEMKIDARIVKDATLRSNFENEETSTNRLFYFAVVPKLAFLSLIPSQKNFRSHDVTLKPTTWSWKFRRWKSTQNLGSLFSLNDEAYEQKPLFNL